MDPLSREASDALKALGAVEPTAGDEARVREGVERALGVVLPVASAAVVTTAVGAKAASMTLKTVLLVVTSFGAGVAVTMAVREPARPVASVVVPVTRQKPAPPPQLEEEPVPGDVQPELVLRAPPLPPRAPVVVKKVAPVVAPEPVVEAPAAPPPPEPSVDDELSRDFAGCDLPSEQRLASHVRSLIPNAKAERGLELLKSYQRRCATGHWAYDSWVARFDLLCSLGRAQEFNELWQWFRVENDRHAERLQAELSGRCQF